MMQRLVTTIATLALLPAFLVPIGLDLHLCFCSIIGAAQVSCCRDTESLEMPSCCGASEETAEGPCAQRGCEGCVNLHLPSSPPRTPVVFEFVAQPLFYDDAQLVQPVAARDLAAFADSPAAPPPTRPVSASMPLLI